MRLCCVLLLLLQGNVMEHNAAAEVETSLKCLLYPLGSENCKSLTT